ncbi:MAG: hypothetical protein JNM27_19625 [Leptospirales bacterium]|nr:hypothetical protein [Leptospirales bacterium]
MNEKKPLPWAASGDWNAFFALFLDNIVNLVLLSGILLGFGFPREIIFERILPGTALGVLFGDVIYSIMAIRLSRRTGQPVTAMPLGLDTPSTIGMAFVVLGPSFLAARGEGMDQAQAGLTAWHVGMAAMIWMGFVKVIFSFLGSKIQRVVPTAALLGSLAGVGITWLAANPLLKIYDMPFVGLMALAVLTFALIAKHDLPFRLPGAAVAVVLGVLLYYGLGRLGFLSAEGMHPYHGFPEFSGIRFLPPIPTLAAFTEVFGRVLPYLPVAIPFGLLTIVGGINVTEGARLVGDDFKTRDILLTEAAATLIAGICGGVAQTTPYIGHSAYRQMGARSAYTLFTGLAVGLGAALGIVGFIVDLIPEAAVSPILIFVGLEILALSFRLTPQNHYFALGFALIPAILSFTLIKLQMVIFPVQGVVAGIQAQLATLPVDKARAIGEGLAGIIPPHVLKEFLVLGALGQGAILTSMIWSATVAYLIDRKFISASVTMIVAAVFTLFGFMHSVFPNGQLYLPWNLASSGLPARSLSIPYEFALCYILMAALFPILYAARRKNNVPLRF